MQWNDGGYDRPTHRTALTRKYRTPMTVIPIRTYRALCIVELSTSNPKLPLPFSWGILLLLVLLTTKLLFIVVTLMTGLAVVAVVESLVVLSATMRAQRMDTSTKTTRNVILTSFWIYGWCSEWFGENAYLLKTTSDGTFPEIHAAFTPTRLRWWDSLTKVRSCSWLLWLFRRHTVLL